MSLPLESILELLAVFAVGLLANRQEPPRNPSPSEVPLLYPVPKQRTSCTTPPDTTRFHGHRTSRWLATFPFALEIFYWALTFWPLRVFTPSSASPLAREHASHLLQLEQTLRLAIELRFQRTILRCPPLLMDAFKLLYTTHTLLIAAFLVYAYTFFPRAHFTAVRRSLVLANLLACALSLLWRCAPPRLMPPVTGFVDVLHDHPPTLPNLHLANALLLSTTTLLYAHHTWLRILAPLYPAGIALSVIATANNWVLDGAPQVLILLLAVYSNRVLLALQPLEGWVFWACRTERPQLHEGKNIG